MNDIANYNLQMRKSLLDKIFFADKMDCKRFVDFGCADGSMIKFLSGIYPENIYYGYDQNKEMIHLASNDNNDNVHLLFTDDIKAIHDFINASNLQHEDVGVIASSILHEIYHFKVQEKFWRSGRCR